MTPFALLCLQFAAAVAAMLAIYGLRALRVETRVIVVVAIVLAFAIGAYGAIISEPREPYLDFVRGYLRGGRAVMHGPHTLVAVLGANVHGFVNIPILAYLFVPFAMLPPSVAAYLWLALGVACLAVLWEMLSRLATLDGFGRAQLAILIGANGPALYGLKEGNTSQMALIGLIGALYLIRKNREFAAGLLIGAMAATKLPLMLYAAYYTARGRWRIVAGGAAILMTLGLLSLAIFGLDLHLRWYRDSISPYTAHPLGAFNVQSIGAFFVRLQEGSRVLQTWWGYWLHPAFDILCKIAVTAALGLPIFVALLSRGREGAPERGALHETLEYFAVFMLTGAISTLTWAHYFCWLLAPLALFMSGGPLEPKELWRKAAVWLSAALLVPVPIYLKLAESPWRKLYALGVSDYLYADLILLTLVLLARLPAGALTSRKETPIPAST